MSKKYNKKLSLDELAATKDKDIDCGDVADLGEAFWNKAVIVMPNKTKSVTLRVKESVLEAYKSMGKGYQTRMNMVLESYIRTLQK